MSIATRRVGDSATVTFSVRSRTGQPVDATVVLAVRRPDGSDPAPTVDHPGLGEYEATFGVNQAGLWSWRWAATGPATAAADGVLLAEAIQAPDLYVTPEELRAELSDDATASPRVDMRRLERACRAASRSVDDWCSLARVGYRRFWLDPTPTARRYVPQDPWRLPVADIGDPTGLTVTVDAVSWAVDVDYQLAPVDAPAGRRAYTRLEALRAQWPVDLTGQVAAFTTSTRYLGAGRPAAPRVVVTARHGWPAIPEPVRTAATIQALRLYKRRGAPFGTEGVTDWGPVRIARNDPDISPLLARYSLGPVLG